MLLKNNKCGISGFKIWMARLEGMGNQLNIPPVAQWLGRGTDNWKVPGLNPAGGASKLWIFHLSDIACIFRKTLLAVDPSYLASIELKDPTHIE